MLLQQQQLLLKILWEFFFYFNFLFLSPTRTELIILAARRRGARTRTSRFLRFLKLRRTSRDTSWTGLQLLRRTKIYLSLSSIYKQLTGVLHFLFAFTLLIRNVSWIFSAESQKKLGDIFFSLTFQKGTLLLKWFVKENANKSWDGVKYQLHQS